MPSDRDPMCSSGGGTLTTLSRLSEVDNSIHADRTILRTPVISDRIRCRPLSTGEDEIEAFSQQQPSADIFRVEQLSPKANFGCPIESAIQDVGHEPAGSIQKLANILRVPENVLHVAAFPVKLLIYSTNRMNDKAQIIVKQALSEFSQEELSPLPRILQVKLDEIFAMLSVIRTEEEDMRFKGALTQIQSILQRERDLLWEKEKIRRLKLKAYSFDEALLLLEEYFGYQVTQETKLARKKAIDDIKTLADYKEVWAACKARILLFAQAMGQDTHADEDMDDDNDGSNRDIDGDNEVASGGERNCSEDHMEVDEEQESMQTTWNLLVERPLVLRAKL